MNDSNPEIIVELQNKIDTLIERYTSLKEDVKSLREKNEKLELELDRVNGDYKRLEEKYSNLRLSGNILAETGNPGEAKKRISQMVREIDKCIALLNR